MRIATLILDAGSRALHQGRLHAARFAHRDGRAAGGDRRATGGSLARGADRVLLEEHEVVAARFFETPARLYGVQDDRNLEVRRLALELADAVYDCTDRFPPDERFEVTRQVRRAVVSVPANISEGAARDSDREFRRFVHIALGSLAETRTLLEFGYRRDWIDGATHEKLEESIETLRRGLRNLVRAIERAMRRKLKAQR